MQFLEMLAGRRAALALDRRAKTLSVTAGLCVALVGCGDPPELDVQDAASSVQALQLTDTQGEVFFGGIYADGELHVVQAVEEAIVAAGLSTEDTVLRLSEQDYAFPQDGIIALGGLSVGETVAIESVSGEHRGALEVKPASWIDHLPEATATRFPDCGGLVAPTRKF